MKSSLVLISQLGKGRGPRLSGAGGTGNTVRGLALPSLPYLPLLPPWGPRGRYCSNELRPMAGIGNYDFMEI